MVALALARASKLLIGSDKFLHGVIFLDGSIGQVVK